MVLMMIPKALDAITMGMYGIPLVTKIVCLFTVQISCFVMESFLLATLLHLSVAWYVYTDILNSKDVI